ncbi:cell division protein FtsA [Vibrio sp. qd031]|jgi:cell division protein FtsA|uniref:Cell division protein FtsA n=1 Tax=Vibrio ulleungensis TaxID=2807619 RepID=A0ABS2HIZ3_9VIBR|nr:MULTISPECIES: cell division protein FtsA [Vibrio]MBM7037495.1 cell division protein FtsA [Vibrio ulleungensis]ORT48323.1 cell division protein FtsA [Vibrio sp. qd031]
MTKHTDDDLVVGLDIGTSSVTAIVGEMLPDGQINVIGVGTSPARGMDKGGVNDLEAVTKSVQRAIDEAALMADCTISKVFLSISGQHITSRIEKGMGTISDEEVAQEDIERVIHTAKSIKIGDEERILHVIPQEFTIDYQAGIKNPVGLSGVRMEVSVHMISCHSDMARNIEKAVHRCNLEVGQVVYSGLAASEAVITDDEKELGVCVVDVGAGTMDVSIWTGGALRHTEVLAYAGNAVTSDIAFAFGTPLSDAEQIKVKFGCALSELVSKDDTVNVPSVGGRPSRSLQRQTLSEVIEPRYTELLGLINQTIESEQEKMRQAGVKHQLAAGIVLTGGAAQIQGLVECAERVFGNQVRVGRPIEVKGLTDYVKAPYMSTAIGLLHYARDNQFVEESDYTEPKSSSLSDMFGKVRKWIQKEF